MTDIDFSQLSDEDLALVARENVDAFGILVDRYEKPLMRYILRLSKFSKAEAEEILQEVFLKAWKNLQGFDSSLRFGSWIYRIAHNATISEFRKYKSRGGEERMEWNDELYESLPDSIDLPREINEKVNAKGVRKVIELLPEKYRSVLVLRFLEEKSYDEISDILHIPLGTAATLVSRAKKQFLEKAKEHSIHFS